MILALAGGIGGAKLVHGLTRLLAPGDMVVAVNTGDDFTHLGFRISPDLDSVTYKLAGMNNTETGWGVADETWNFMAAMERLGGETWFRLGDKDLATHVERSRLLAAGGTLSQATEALCAKLSIAHAIAPMSDDPVHTTVITEDGRLAFQDYFVRLKAEPRVTGFAFNGAAQAVPSPVLANALASNHLDAVIVCPSNPFVSIDPIMALPALAAFLDGHLEGRKVPVIAVSPIIDGAAVKGPAAKMMGEMGFDVSPRGIADHYRGRIDGLVIDTGDENYGQAIEAVGIKAHATETLMTDAASETRLAAAVLEFTAIIADGFGR